MNERERDLLAALDLSQDNLAAARAQSDRFAELFWAERARVQELERQLDESDGRRIPPAPEDQLDYEIIHEGGKD